MKVSIIAHGESVFENEWIVVQKVDNNALYHTSLYTIKKVDPSNPEIDIPRNIDQNSLWTKSGYPIILDISLALNPRVNGYYLTSKLDFGLYEGIEVGMVYALDILYIEWCILNIDDFVIIDLFKLQDIGVFSRPRKNAIHRDKTPLALKFLYEFKSILELVKEVPVLNPEYRLDTSVYLANQMRI